jgi:hypothetical protein
VPDVGDIANVSQPRIQEYNDLRPLPAWRTLAELERLARDPSKSVTWSSYTTPEIIRGWTGPGSQDSRTKGREKKVKEKTVAVDSGRNRRIDVGCSSSSSVQLATAPAIVVIGSAVASC